MSPKFFGTDGIRGTANSWPITPDIALKVGMAAGLVFKRGAYRHRVVIGKDTRLSGYMIENALVAGFTAVGMDVFQLGPMPTPAVAMLTRSLRADLGVMISASHNPYADNGIKLFGPDGFKLSDEVETRIEALLGEDLGGRLAGSADLGRAKRVDGVRDRYIEFAKRTLPRNVNLEGIRVAVDCANGAAYRVAPEALWELGADVVAIGNAPNGFNINKDCGSTDPAELCRKVHEVRADIVIELDLEFAGADLEGKPAVGNRDLAPIAGLAVADTEREPAAWLPVPPVIADADEGGAVRVGRPGRPGLGEDDQTGLLRAGAAPAAFAGEQADAGRVADPAGLGTET